MNGGGALMTLGDVTTATAPSLPRSPVGISLLDRAAVSLYWLPLGAGGHCVRLNGRVFEAISAWKQHRKPCHLYHSALEVTLDGERYVIEMAPVWNERTPERGVGAQGSVGMRGAGRLALFRCGLARPADGALAGIQPPTGGRAPGWAAGVIAAARFEAANGAARAGRAIAAG